jgi:transposase
MNMEETLFPLPPEQASDETVSGKPRLKRANRAQVQFRTMDLDSSLPSEHPARLVWEFVQQLDLGPWYAEIRAVEGQAGQNAIDPAILMALWLYATLEGVGSARALDRLCKEHDAFRWICGGVTVNYHTLSDFRVNHTEHLEELLTKSVAALLVEGLVKMNRVSQDGKRVRASAGSKSFRRRKTLQHCLRDAREQVEGLRKELEEHPEGTSKRQKAAQERAKRERQERVEKALERMKELEARQEKNVKAKMVKREKLKPARASTTDPEAQVMKMPDGGFRPAYNAQFSTDTESMIIVGVDVTNQGNDSGLTSPMVAQIQEHYHQVPDEYLVDGGFVNLDDFTKAGQMGTKIYAPVTTNRTPKTDPYQPKRGDSLEIIAWRKRMATDQAKQIYKERASTAECINAIQHNRGLTSFRVRGLQKVKAVLLWFALIHNLMRGYKLRLEAQKKSGALQAA